MDSRRTKPILLCFFFLSLSHFLSAQQDPRPTRAQEQPKLTAGRDGLRYVWIPPGRFEMGCSPSDTHCDTDEQPRHAVTISRGFWMGQTEVTVEAYRRYTQATGKSMPPDLELFNKNGIELNPGWTRPQLPIVDVNWNDAQAYCTWASARLPSDAEREYAARAGSTDAQYGPLEEIAWYADNSGREHLDSQAFWNSVRQRPNADESYLQRLKGNGNGMHEVASKRPNAFGLYDMLGSVREWCADWYEDTYYRTSPATDPVGPTSGTTRVVRGGSFDHFPLNVRLSDRFGRPPELRMMNIGFRCVRDVTP
jgi:sulfatase modifying factor 1